MNTPVSPRWSQPICLPVLTFIMLVMLMATTAAAQNTDRKAFVPEVIKAVLLDPTTYAPAIVGWGATRLDWQSSQIFFENGSVEHNSRFTLSGRSDDTAIGYAAGNRQILTDALANLQMAVVNNVSARVMERLLLPRYPGHRRLIRAVGWIERSAVASMLSYQLSADHFHQWRENDRRAAQLGY